MKNKKGAQLRIALLHAFRTSEWKSCIGIKNALLKAYKKLQHNYLEFDYDHFKGALHLDTLAFEIAQFHPDIIIFIDHRPTPKHILERLLKNNCRAPILVHLYGDFSVYSPQWQEIDPWTRNFQTMFISASGRQSEFVGQFLNDPTIMRTIPFPIDDKVFYYSEKEASSFAKRFQLSTSVPTLLYAGRITEQKNTALLVESFYREVVQKNKKMVLLLAGDIDDEGTPFLGKYRPRGCSYLELERYFCDQIKWLGPLSQDLLRGAYSFGDYLISLSLFHDEDFGLSSLEAAQCGQGLILSDWGGHGEFLRHFNDSLRIPVSFESSSGFRLQRDDLTKIFLGVQRLKKETRYEHSLQCSKKFSIDTVSKQLSQALQDVVMAKKFAGFNTAFWKFSTCFKSNANAPFQDGGQGPNFQIYRQSYHAYIN